MDGQKKNEPDIVIVNVPQVSLHVWAEFLHCILDQTPEIIIPELACLFIQNS
jgi:hypothetical protein